MIGRLAALILLSTMSFIQTADVSHLSSLTVVDTGENVTLLCPVFQKTETFLYWYKQPLGQMVQTVASGVFNNVQLRKTFANSRFHITEAGAQYQLTITNVSKVDEATFFCLSGTAYSQRFSNGIFLAVNDRNRQKSIYVKQSPEAESVQLGQPIHLQCSLLSEDKENPVQCPGEGNVHWVRAGSGESHPGIIYIHKNKTEGQNNRTCVYHLSKTIQDLSDSGTYYCAVATCGQILFGEGTKVEIGMKVPFTSAVCSSCVGGCSG
ncbi:uncharacterized protein LOC115426802 [Sphaeramia orbicularis]|uniref:uncharacterized protein LOC115426802 n=1 Tax=Sphaeramia orbicularis TaxID=375764 RepID=UPI00117DCF49|nr:uncharacterized protein LOC115426802 [Sphaeramia orbicularis]